MEPIKILVASTKPTWLAKLSLRSISAVVAIALLGIVSSIAARRRSSNDDDYYYYSSDSYLPIVILGAQIIVSICWTIAEIVCLIVRTGHRGIHPGACVVMDLLLWITLVIGVIVLSLICWGGWCGDYFDEDGDDTTGLSLRDAWIALGVILIVAHFVLFVIACWETSVRNRAVRVILDRNGELLKGPEGAYKAYQSYQQSTTTAPQPVALPPPAAFAPVPAPVPTQLYPQPPAPGQLYPSAAPSRRPVASDASYAPSNPGQIPSPSEVSSVSPVAPNAQHTA